jgi:hypothetical protein
MKEIELKPIPLKVPAKNILLSTEQILGCTGITLGALKDCLKHKFITPSQPSIGKRSRNLYSFKDAVLIKLIKVLTESEIPRKFIAPIAKGLSAIKISPDDPFTDDVIDPISNILKPKSGKTGKSIIDYPKISLKFVNCGEIYKVGIEYTNANGNIEYLYRLVRGSDLRVMNLFECSPEINARLADSANDQSLDVTLFISLTRVNLEVQKELSKIMMI